MILFLRFIQVIAYLSILCCCWMVLHWIDIPHLFICSLVDGHLFGHKLLMVSLKLESFKRWWNPVYQHFLLSMVFFVSYFKNHLNQGQEDFLHAFYMTRSIFRLQHDLSQDSLSKRISSPHQINIFIKNEFTWVYFWSINSVPLIGISILYQYHTILVTFAF